MKEMKTCQQKDLWPQQKLKTAQSSSNRQMDKQIIHIHLEILLSNQQEAATDTHTTQKDLKTLCQMRVKEVFDERARTLYYSIYMEYIYMKF